MARYFLSYAHADSADAGRFLAVLTPQLNSVTGARFERWRDQDNILPGEDWHDEIQAAIKACDFGLLLVSPAFLASGYVRDHELDALLAKPMVVPVLLQPVLDLGKLKHRQVFRDAEGRSFDQCGRMHTRRAFALELHQRINALLAKAAAV